LYFFRRAGASTGLLSNRASSCSGRLQQGRWVMPAPKHEQQQSKTLKSVPGGFITECQCAAQC
jgi:hypothetical protein